MANEQWVAFERAENDYVQRGTVKVMINVGQIWMVQKQDNVVTLLFLNYGKPILVRGSYEEVQALLGGVKA